MAKKEQENKVEIQDTTQAVDTNITSTETNTTSQIVDTPAEEKVEKPNGFFDQYPQAKKYFETADGRKFFNVNDARNHANTLKNKSVNEIKK